MNEGDDLFFIGAGAERQPLEARMAGAKAAELSRVAALGLEIPPAFVLSTGLCAPVNAGSDEALRRLEQGLASGIRHLERASGCGFGDGRRPLIVSVRSGAAKSMPGMLETVLDVGLNAATVHGLIRTTGNPRLAWDSYRRLIEGYATVVDGVPGALFAACVADMMAAEGVSSESELDPEALERLTSNLCDIATGSAGRDIPHEPMQQLTAVAKAVYRSWETEKAREYRRINSLENLGGTAVMVQAMVFGNAGGHSGAGVAFSRNPATGAKELYADFLFDAQGEDVVSGRRRPAGADALARRMPDVAAALATAASRLEREFRDMQDIEFTVENNRLFILQTRAGKRTPHAALRTAIDLVHEDVIDEAEALRRLDHINLAAISTAHFVGTAPRLAVGTPASVGVAHGRIAFDIVHAKALAGRGDPVILLRHETSTDDIVGFGVAVGILTAVGGRTSHAAVVARELGKVCIVGCSGLAVDADARRAMVAGTSLDEGDWISLDGESGEIFLGRREVTFERPEADLATVKQWRVRTACSADKTQHDRETATSRNVQAAR
jgi:pyruvate,orthophosphate dikinase